MTALHMACTSGFLDAVKLLLEHNAFPNHMEYTEDHFTPLDYALLNDHHEVSQYMIEQGALSITSIRDIAATRIQVSGLRGNLKISACHLCVGSNHRYIDLFKE